MHVTRPTSSKGRSRTAAINNNNNNNPLHAGDPGSTHRLPASPDSDSRGPDRNLRCQSQPIMWHQAGQLSREEVLQMLQHAPTAPPLSLNKYKVLPSIEKRHTEQKHRHMEPDLPLMKAMSQTSSWGEVERSKPSYPTPTQDHGVTAGSLLLAVRAPCGRRFEQHFDPTDKLLAVRASAEVRYGAQYGDVCMETMDVPRRTFTDMDMTLAQCGIVSRSVLCISQKDSMVEHN